MSKQPIIFVSGETITYDLDNSQQQLLLLAQSGNCNELAPGVYWVPSLSELAENYQHLL